MARHPHAYELAALHDNEVDDAAVERHVRRCLRCSRALREMDRVDAFVRGDELPLPVVHRRRSGWLAAAAYAAVLGLIVGRAISDSPASVPDPPTGVDAAAPTLEGEPNADEPRPTDRRPLPAAAQPPKSEGSAAVTAAPDGGAEASPDPLAAAAAAPKSAGQFRVATVVPTRGAHRDEGREVATAVHAAIEAANASGGVGGLPVLFTVVAAEDEDAVARLADSADVVVGGLGVDAVSVPWFFPIDAAVRGDGILSRQPLDADAARVLADVLAPKLKGAPLGIVFGDGEERAFGDELAMRLPVVRRNLDDYETCGSQLRALRAEGAAAIALAMHPGEVTRCMTGMGTLGWRPRQGVLIPPSAADGFVTNPSGATFLSVLGLPWHTWREDLGVARVQRVTGLESHEALVSFAATELAIAVARSAGSAAITAVATGTWHNDLWRVEGSANRRLLTVSGTGRGWQLVPATEQTRE